MYAIAQFVRGLSLAAVFLMPLAAGAQDRDALTAARFEISIDGHSIASFSELAGISSSSGDIDQVPGQQPRGLVILRRGLSRNLELWHWFERDGSGAVRRDMTLAIYNRRHEVIARYNLIQAWPAKIEVSALKAGASEVLMESVTMVCEHLQRVAP